MKLRDLFIKKATVFCAYCGTIIKGRDTRVIHDDNVFCSDDCKDEHVEDNYPLKEEQLDI